MELENKLNIAGAVILYQPDWDDVVKNIQSYLPYVDQLYVFNNTEQKNIPLPELLSQSGKIIYFNEGENEGIAKRLNQACRFAIQNGFEWLLTMDQDSRFEDGEMAKYLEEIKVFPDKGKTAVFGVNHEISSPAQSRAFEVKDYLITSGSVVYLNLFDKIGGFDECLFIDGVDIDYCFKAKLKGFQSIQFPVVNLTHHLGILVDSKLGKSKRVLHSPNRFFYMVRNFFYLREKYKGRFLDYQRMAKVDLFNRIKNYLLLGDKKTEMIKNVILGWKAYKSQKMGKL